jgi:PAS domain S-box-containing protein
VGKMSYEFVEYGEDNTLKDSQEIYKTIFENSAVAITVTDENEKIISWNKYAEDLLGMTRDDLYNKPVESLYLPEEWKKIRAENIREKGMQHHLETKILRKNNEPLDVDISLSVLKNNEGDITGAIGVIKDISERVQAQEKLSYEHSLFQALLDNVPDSIYFKDENNRFILVNKAKAEHSTLSPEDMIGKTDYDFLPEHQARKAFENDNNIMKTGQPIIDEVEKLTGKDGSERWVSVTKIPRYSSEGKIIGTMGISRDVTKRVKETKETEKYKKVAIGQNLRIVELRDRVKELITEMEKDK